MAIQASGIATNFDVNAVVSQLLEIERRPLGLLGREAERANTRISAYGSLKSAMAALQSAMRALETPERLRAAKATVADPAVAGAAASAGATPGTHALEVSALAQAHRLKSAAFTSPLDEVGGGTLTFQYGTYVADSNAFTLNPARGTESVVIGAGATTLAGIREAVNAANIGVSASIVNDGAGERLVFASRSSGAANSLRIGVVDNDGTPLDDAGLSRLAYDPTAAAGSGKNLAQSAAASDAAFLLDGIEIKRASNQVADALAGVTLDLRAAAPGKPVLLSVTRDRQAVSEAVDGFVKAYNAYRSVHTALTAKGKTLQGDAVALSLDARVRSAMTAAPLSRAGVVLQSDGRLTLDAGKLEQALSERFDEIAELFAALGKPSDSRVAWISAAAATRPGAYALNVTQAPARGSLTGSQAAGLTVTAGVDDHLSFTVDGASAGVTLPAGTYASAAALALELQSRLNGALAAAGKSVGVSASAGVLSVTSAAYGAASAVTLAAGEGATARFGASPASADGVDAAGALGGFAARSEGRELVGAAGTSAEGLRVRLLSASSGDFGEVRFIRGAASRIAALAEEALGTNAAIEARIAGLNASLRANARRQSDMQEDLAAAEKRLRAQFTALDRTLSRMSATSAYLQQQLAQLPRPGR